MPTLGPMIPIGIPQSSLPGHSIPRCDDASEAREFVRSGSGCGSPKTWDLGIKT